MTVPSQSSPRTGDLARAMSIGLAAALAFACSDPHSSGADGVVPDRPDLIVLMLDTLRPDHLGSRGYARETSPFLDALSADAVRFPRAFSTSSWTAPATASVFTGLYPPRHGVFEGMVAQEASTATQRNGAERLELRTLPSQLATLPERLREAGYATYGIAANINVGEAIGFSRGFDRFEHPVDEHAGVLVDRLVAWKREVQASRAPVFVYAHFNDTHEPYAARSPWIEQYRAEPGAAADERFDARARYDSELAFLDRELDRLVRSFGWRDASEGGREAVIVVISDHGEEFWEHGKLGHGYQLFDELNRALFLVYAPDRFAARDVATNVSLVDVVPTLLELAEVPLDPSAPVDGASLVPLLEGASEDEAPWKRRTVYAHRFKTGRWWRRARNPIWAVMEPRWKLVVHGDRTMLFDLETDPREKDDRSRREPGRTAEMRIALERFQEEATPLARRGDATEVELDEVTRRRLEALGYVDAADGNESADRGGDGPQSEPPEDSR